MAREIIPGQEEFGKCIPVGYGKTANLFLQCTYMILYIICVDRKKKFREFPVYSRDVTTKLSLGGNYDVITELFLPRGSLVSDIPAEDGKLVNLFLRCSVYVYNAIFITIP